jgi:hypothetical protein
MLICMNCGSTKNLQAELVRLVHVYGWADIDQKTGEAIIESFEENGEEDTESDLEETGDYLCNGCGYNGTIKNIEENELLLKRLEHTDKNCRWRREVLPENERNERLANEYIVAKL